MRMHLPEALGALREREFRLLFTGQAISLLGDGMVGVALAFAVLDLTGSVTDLGIVFAARTIPLVVFLLVGGVFADRLPRRAVMLTADLVRLTTQGVIAVLLISRATRRSGSSRSPRPSTALRRRFSTPRRPASSRP